MHRVLVLAGLLFLATPLEAAEGRDPLSAEALFREGRQASAEEDWALACAKFEESRRLDPTPGAALNLAVCNEKLGKLGDAWQYAREALDALEALDDRRPIAQELINNLEPRVPRLVVTVDTTSAEVFRDGVLLGKASLDTPLPANPGVHYFEVRAKNHEPRGWTVHVSAGESRTLRLSVGPLISSPQAAPKPQSLGPWFWAGAGIGAAGLLVGTIGGAIVLDRKGAVEANCDDALACKPDGLSAAASGRTWATVSTIGFAAAGGGVLLAALSLVLRGADPKMGAIANVDCSEPGIVRIHFQ